MRAIIGILDVRYHIYVRSTTPGAVKRATVAMTVTLLPVMLSAHVTMTVAYPLLGMAMKMRMAVNCLTGGIPDEHNKFLRSLNAAPMDAETHISSYIGSHHKEAEDIFA